MSRIAIAILIGVIVFVPATGFADGSDDVATLEELAIQTAKTAQDHEALAHYYQDKADEARTEAHRHEEMGRSYRNGKLTQRNRMRTHCQKISKQYEEMANEYEALAKLHEQEAK